MCGICGTINFGGGAERQLAERMLRLITHRGPDELGIYADRHAALGHARLSILDLSGGRQPIHNEDRTIWITYNGEIFNYRELRDELVAAGHRFYTHTDTEVLVHLYEENGTALFGKLNGQFAFVIWDSRKRRILAGRDRMGIRPFYYTCAGNDLLFSSEIKAFLADERVSLSLDARGLDQICTMWAGVPPRTVFENINELPPAHYLIADTGGVTVRRYWDVPFTPVAERGSGEHPEKYYAERLRELLLDSIRLRLRADVPVAAYLSGGIDSSIITALVTRHFDADLKTFSVSFTDKDYDESVYQRRMADFLGTEHREVKCTPTHIGGVMADVVWAAEKPLIRTAPAPMYLLSGLVRNNGIKVVLTGEGSDEILGGYDLFREMKIRRFWAKDPASKWRPALLSTLSRYIHNGARHAPAYLEAYYRSYLKDTGSPYYSHVPRWETTAATKNFFSASMKAGLAGYDSRADFVSTLPSDFSKWGFLSQAQYIEINTLLSGNLLSSQGDRMAMAHAVEGRYPFLDYRLVEFAATIPEHLRMNGLKEKYLLKKMAAEYLPAEIITRPKQAYRSPDSASFFSGADQEYIDTLLSEDNLRRCGYFDPVMVRTLAAKCRAGDRSLISAKHNIAITAIITTLMLDDMFIRNRGKRGAQPSGMPVADMSVI